MKKRRTPPGWRRVNGELLGVVRELPAIELAAGQALSNATVPVQVVWRLWRAVFKSSLKSRVYFAGLARATTRLTSEFIWIGTQLMFLCRKENTRKISPQKLVQ
jgi:hypothetical protein